MEMDLGPLFGLWFQSLFVGITMWALMICIFIITFGRMIEIYLVTSVAPVPMADHDGQGMGRYGAELPPIPAGAGLPGVSYHRLRGHLCCAGAEHCPGRTTSSTPSGRAWATRCCCASRSVQDEQHGQIRIQCPLTEVTHAETYRPSHLADGQRFCSPPITGTIRHLLTGHKFSLGCEQGWASWWGLPLWAGL